MTDRADRLHHYEEIVQRMAGAIRAAHLYAPGHPTITALIRDLLEVIRRLHAIQPIILIGFVGGEVIADDTPLERVSSTRSDLTRSMESLGVHRILLEPGVTTEELGTFLQAVLKATPLKEDEQDLVQLPHLRAGRIPLDPEAGGSGSGAAAIRKVYRGAVSAARVAWESAAVEGMPDLRSAREAVEELADSVGTSRPLMLGLTGMKDHDDYTFTHMVNVSILTMAQARGLGIDGERLRDLGLAGLLHDIGKIRTPQEILTNSTPLTERQFAIIKRHPVDGATILRRTRGMPPIAPIVALEHHLRLDGTGYPERINRPTLNLATMMCGIADVYDAMRSKRQYQEASPTDRVIAVMQRNDGRQFDQLLVKRFIRIIGVYPPGTLVQLHSGEVAVVLQTDGPDPHFPTVRLLFDRTGNRLARPETRRLWRELGDADAVGVAGRVEPAKYQVDPLAYLIAA